MGTAGRDSREKDCDRRKGRAEADKGTEGDKAFISRCGLREKLKRRSALRSAEVG